MKILHVISRGYICGGAEQCVAALKTHLPEFGHESRVLASDICADDPSTFSDYRFPHIRPGSRSYLRRFWNHQAFRAIKLALKDFEPDLIHFHTMGELSPSAIFAAGKTAAVLTIHGPEPYTKGMLKWYLKSDAYKTNDIRLNNLTPRGRISYSSYRYLQRPLYVWGFRRHLSVIVSSSKSLEQAFREDENFGVAIRQIYSGFRLPPYQQLPPNQTITFLGRLSYVKGVEFLIEAMREVSKSLPEARLILMGAGPDEIRLRRLVRDSNLTDCIFFLGWIRNDEAIRQLGESRVVVIPSIWPENQPTTCIEAMGVGRPVIGTNVGGIPELIVDGKNGYIVPPADARALAQALTRILGDEGLCEAMSVDTRARVKQFGVSTFVRQMASLYDETCSRASEPIFGRTRPVPAGRSSAPAWRRRSR